LRALYLRALSLPALCLLALCAVPAAGAPGAGAEAPSRSALSGFRAQVDGLLEASGLPGENVALLLFSTRSGRYLYQRAIHRPMIPASNAKLLTTYAALKALSPDHRWRTRFYLVDEKDDPSGETRQGLLVEGAGDPTLSVEDLRETSLYLRSLGLSRLEGGIHFDGRAFDEVSFPDSWGDVSRGEHWFAPVSPFIVQKNVIEFLITGRPDTSGFEVFTATPGFVTVSTLRRGGQERPQVWVEQDWHEDQATFTFSGSLPPAREPYHISAAVERPRVHFYRLLRDSLARAGIAGELPLRLEGPVPARKKLLYTRISPPLREVIVEVNKNSSNLAAEVLLRTMGALERHEGVSAEDGLTVMRRTIARHLAPRRGEWRLVDGSGLSRENRVSAEVLVRLLNRVRYDFRIRPEFINSLSVALTDGTLQYRQFPWQLKGRLRAKTGTLAGVSNLTGYLQLPGDIVIFSFLVNVPGRPYQELQDAQDRLLGELYPLLEALQSQPAR
jgi:D-alanyl-D-alanine carboxypeptidase/D-alanyl-D-alanine-endopeptidase (penicillin-binding protein 4)